MRDTTSRAALVLAVAFVLVFAASGTAGAAGAPQATADESGATARVSASPATPGSTSTHTVTEVVGNGTNGSAWTDIEITYRDTSGVLSHVDRSSIEKIGIDRGNDAPGTKTDVNVESDVTNVSAEDGGTTLDVELEGAPNLEPGDQLVLVYSDVVNPRYPGLYTVSVDANERKIHATSEAANPLHANSMATGIHAFAALHLRTARNRTRRNASALENGTVTETSSGGASSGGASSGGDSSGRVSSGGASSGGASSGGESGPGFGVAVAVVGLAGAAFLSSRRR